MKTLFRIGGFLILTAWSGIALGAADEAAGAASERALLEAEREQLVLERERLEAERERVHGLKEALEEVRGAVETARGMSENFPWMWRGEDEAGDPPNTLYFGVTIESVPRALRRHIDLPEGVGILLSKVHADSPAAKAGVEDDDILVEFAGQLILNYDQLSKLIKLQQAGRPVTLTVLRKGERVGLEIQLEERVRRSGKWLPVPPKPPAPANSRTPAAAPASPAPPRVSDSVREAIARYVPASVRVTVDDEHNVEVDLSGLHDTLTELEARLERLQLDGANADWGELVDIYREVANRRSVVRMTQTRMSLSTDEGRVRIFQEEEGRRAVVSNPQGEIIFDGIIPENYEQSLDPAAARLIRALLDARQHLDTDLSSEGAIEVREVDETEEPSGF